MTPPLFKKFRVTIVIKNIQETTKKWTFLKSRIYNPKSTFESKEKKVTPHYGHIPHEIDFEKISILDRKNQNFKLPNLETIYINFFREKLITITNERAEIDSSY